MQSLDEAQFKKIIENLQPQSSATHKLCERLGYNIKDLKYKQLKDFQAITPELQRIKYEHYKARTMRIIQDIIEVRHRHKHQTQMQSKISFTFLPETKNMTTKVEFSEISSNSFTEEMPDIDGDQRLKVTQRLIRDELQRKKKYAEYMRQQNLKENKTANKDHSMIQRRVVTEQSKQHIPRTDDQNYTNRLQYLTLEQEAIFRASTMKSQSLKTKSKLFKNESIEIKKKEQQKDFEQFQKKTLQDLEKKEQEVKNKIKLFRNGTVSQLQVKSKQNAEILQRKEILNEEQMNDYLLKQCQKLENITQRREQLRQIENKERIQKQLLQLKQKQKFIQNLEKQQHNIEVKNMQKQEYMEQKMEKVQFDKQRFLKSKSDSIKELKQIKLEDVQFNRYHNQQLQLQFSGKIFEKTEYATDRKQKSQIKFELNRTQAILLHQKQVQKEVQLWKQVKKATQLFDDPMEYERYKLDLKAVMLKQKPSLEQKFIYLTNLIKQILPSNEAELILMPEGLMKEIEIEKSKVKKPR